MVCRLHTSFCNQSFGLLKAQVLGSTSARNNCVFMLYAATRALQWRVSRLDSARLARKSRFVASMQAPAIFCYRAEDTSLFFSSNRRLRRTFCLQLDYLQALRSECWRSLWCSRLKSAWLWPRLSFVSEQGSCQPACKCLLHSSSCHRVGAFSSETTFVCCLILCTTHASPTLWCL